VGILFRAAKDETGKPRQRTKQGFATKREAEEKLRAAIAQHEATGAEHAAPKPDSTLAAFFDLRMTEYAEDIVRPRLLTDTASSVPTWCGNVVSCR
jgi:hypothetical protein